jgi:hypothetical protein
MREKYDTLLRVRGSVKIYSMMMAMTLDTMVQMTWLVMAFIAMETVSMWDLIYEDDLNRLSHTADFST